MNELTTETFDKETQDRILIDFWAPWCGPCKTQATILEKMNKEGVIKIAKVDVDSNPQLAQRYGIIGIPTLILLDKGKEVKRLIGVQSEVMLRKEIL